jgi:hypothetical protein
VAMSVEIPWLLLAGRAVCDSGDPCLAGAGELSPPTAADGPLASSDST